MEGCRKETRVGEETRRKPRCSRVGGRQELTGRGVFELGGDLGGLSTSQPARTAAPWGVKPTVAMETAIWSALSEHIS